MTSDQKCPMSAVLRRSITYYLRDSVATGKMARMCELFDDATTAVGFQTVSASPAISQSLLFGHRHKWHSTRPPPPAASLHSPNPLPPPPPPPALSPPPLPCSSGYEYTPCQQQVDCPPGLHCALPRDSIMAGAWRRSCHAGISSSSEEHETLPLIPTHCGGCTCASSNQTGPRMAQKTAISRRASHQCNPMRRLFQRTPTPSLPYAVTRVRASA